MGPDAPSGRRGAGRHTVQQSVAIDARGVHGHTARRLFKQSEIVHSAGGALAVQRPGGGGEPADEEEAEAGAGRSDQLVRRALKSKGKPSWPCGPSPTMK